jgi:hypothetical protein
VRQHEVPQGKHAIIIVSQPKGNLVWVATDALSAMAKTEKEKQNSRIRIWDECDQVQVSQKKNHSHFVDDSHYNLSKKKKC